MRAIVNTHPPTPSVKMAGIKMCIRDRPKVDAGIRFITSYVNLFRIYIAPHCLLDILWKIHNNRPWFTSPGDEKGFSDDTPKILSVPDRDGMLANTPDVYKRQMQNWSIISWVNGPETPRPAFLSSPPSK